MPEIFHPYASFGHQSAHADALRGRRLRVRGRGRRSRRSSRAPITAPAATAQFPSLEDDIILNGDGMARMFRFENGHVSFRSRYVQTERLKREREARRRLYGHYRNKFTDDESVSNLPQRDNTGNTNAFNHHGELFMLREDSRPYRMDPETLETIEVGRFGNLGIERADRASQDRPEDRRMVELRRVRPRRADHRRLAACVRQGGRLVREEWFHTPYPGLSHDWGVTREHLVFPIMPLTADDRRLRAGGQYYQYDPDLPSRLGDHAARRLTVGRCAGSRSPASSWAT